MPDTDLKDTNNQNFVISRNNKGDSHIHPAHELIGQGLTEIKSQRLYSQGLEGYCFIGQHKSYNDQHKEGTEPGDRHKPETVPE